MSRLSVSRRCLCTIIATLLLIGGMVRATPRQEIDLSGAGWSLWQDKAASWEHDPLFPPPVDVSKLPINAPTGGWGVLRSSTAMAVEVPGTAEQYLQKVPGPAGDLTGVTWWSRDITLPTATSSRHVALRFESVRQRAEVYLDGKLVGYDLIGNTPFEVDLTSAVRPGQTAKLAVRITDPGGNFDWHDKGLINWSDNKLILSHGFGGITGRVRLVISDPTYIDDLYVQNMPQVTTVHAALTIQNTSGWAVTKTISVSVRDRQHPDQILATQKIEHAPIPPGESTQAVSISLPDAKWWDPDHPNLYLCEASLGDDADATTRTFGFRWFEPVGIGSNAMFRLNGKRIVLRSAISWGFFPINGIFATPEMAEKQIKTAKAMGLNMLNFHRCIGQPEILDKADELGLLYYEEPGNYASGASGEDGSLQRIMCREKLLRMVKRDRSHPSLIIYNMSNESAASDKTLDNYVADMTAAHALDPSRTITRTSGLRSTPGIEIELANKYHMRPFDSVLHKSGWYDDHHAGGMAVWSQQGYVSPEKYLQRVSNPVEIVFWGEEGALSTPPRLGLIEEELKSAPQLGWDGQMYRDWYKLLDKFLSTKNLRSSFPTVDDLCVAMGNLSMEHQGRRIQAIRINNDTDGYVINGWESEIIENHSGVVDCFRNPKGDPSIIARFNQPTFIAVMPRNQVLQAPGTAVIDLYAINEAGLKGPHHLHVSASDAKGGPIFAKDFDVTLIGGDVYGQLLAAAVNVPLPREAIGFTRISASLRGSDGSEVCKGYDDVFAVNWKDQPLSGAGAIIDGPDSVSAFLREQKKMDVPIYADTLKKLDWVVTSAPPSSATPVPVPAKAFDHLRITLFNHAGFKDKAIDGSAESVDIAVPEGAPPETGVNALQNYSARWEGSLRPDSTGDYAFSIQATGSATVIVNGESVARVGTTRDSAPLVASVHLTAQQPAAIIVEWQQTTGDAKCRLLWKSPTAQSASDPQKLLRRVQDEGTTLIVLANAAEWAEQLAKFDSSIRYNGSFTVGKAWSGGEHFVKAHPLFADLPTKCGMDWPYQAVVRDGLTRSGLLLDSGELVAGAFHANMSEAKPPSPIRLGTAVGIVPLGKGKVILSTLEIAGNLSAPEGPADVARKLLCNFINDAHPE